MRRSFIVASLLLLATLNSGCTSQIEQAYTSRMVFNGALQDLITAKQTGAIGDTQFATALTVANEITPVLDQLDQAAIEEKPIQFETLYAPMKTKLRAFLIQVAAVKKGKT